MKCGMLRWWEVEKLSLRRRLPKIAALACRRPPTSRKPTICQLQITIRDLRLIILLICKCHHMFGKEIKNGMARIMSTKRKTLK